MKKLLLSVAVFGTIFSSKAQLPDGSLAPNFTVNAYQSWLSTAGANGNGSYTLYDYLDQGYTVFLDVSATWCGPCWNYHLSGALDDVYINHGPAGYPGVATGTTDDVMVIWVEGDGTTADATMLDGSGTIGNWIEPNTTLGQIQFPMANPASALATQINNDYAIGYFPTIYRICPNRIVTEVGQASATQLYNSVGACPPPASNPADVSALSYAGATVHCEGSYTPSVKIQNNGTDPLTSATITITQGGTTVSTGTYSGSLTTYDVATVNCTPIANFTGGALAVTVTTAGDANTSNNNVNATIGLAATAASTYVTIDITTDQYASETSWKIKNASGAVVAQGGGTWTDLGAAGTTVRPQASANLNANACYTFEILDAYGDGICCAYGNGVYTVKDVNGTVLATGGEFTDIEVSAFKTGVANINELDAIALNVFPNPATDAVNVVFEATASDYNVSLSDLQGRTVASQTIENANGTQTIVFATDNVAKGSYIVTVRSNGATTTKNVVIK